MTLEDDDGMPMYDLAKHKEVWNLLKAWAVSNRGLVRRRSANRSRSEAGPSGHGQSPRGRAPGEDFLMGLMDSLLP